MDAAPKLISPAARPHRPLPKLALILFAGSVVAGIFLRPGREGALEWLGYAVQTVAILSACSMASAFEERLYSIAARRSALQRLLLGLLVPPLGLFGGLLSAAIIGVPLQLLGLGETAAPALVLAGWWMALAGLGSLTVVVLDVLVSAVARDFRSRIVLAVFGLIGLSTGLAVTFAMIGTWTLDLLAGRGLQKVSGSFNFTVANEPVAGAAKGLIDESAVRPLAVILACGAGLVALPVLLSACAKLADAVMERLHPLSRAFAEVSSGNLAVQVEEGGSQDFIQLSRAFNGMVGSLGLAKRMDRAYGAYLGKHVAERIKAQHGEAALPASSRSTSVFFADIRGFTSMSERLEPPQVLGILNRYFEKVVATIDAHEGYLNKFIGDAVVVVFNAPLEQPDHAARSVACAIAIQRQVCALNDAGVFGEVGGLQVGIGIATGPVVAGNLGSEKQMEYTVIGDTVNLAARLTGQAPAGEVWVNAACAEALSPGVKRSELPPMKLKGKEQEVRPWRVWP